MEKRIYCPLANHQLSDGLCTEEKCRWWIESGKCCVIEHIADILFDLFDTVELARRQK